MMTKFFGLNQVPDSDSWTRKEQHQVTKVVPTCTGTFGMAAELFGRDRHNFACAIQKLDRKGKKVLKLLLTTGYLSTKVCLKFPSEDEPGVQEIWIPLISFGCLKVSCVE